MGVDGRRGRLNAAGARSEPAWSEKEASRWGGSAGGGGEQGINGKNGVVGDEISVSAFSVIARMGDMGGLLVALEQLERRRAKRPPKPTGALQLGGCSWVDDVGEPESTSDGIEEDCEVASSSK